MNILVGMQIGLEFALMNFFSVYFGYQIDKFFSSQPLFFLIGIVFGFSMSLYRLLHFMNKHAKNSQNR